MQDLTKGAKHPQWQPQLTFRASTVSGDVLENYQVTVHGTGVLTPMLHGVRERPDEMIIFRKGAYTAHATKLFKIHNAYTDEDTVIDEVQWMLTNEQYYDPQYAPRGGIKGFHYHIERGDEDGVKSLEIALAAERARPGSISSADILKLARGIEGARSRVSRERGPLVVRGIRDETVRGDKPDDPGEPVRVTDLPEHVQHDFRARLRRG